LQEICELKEFKIFVFNIGFLPLGNSGDFPKTKETKISERSFSEASQLRRNPKIWDFERE